MDRYYKILGIPNNSSKEVIKKAYYTKMKALHPDKIHGTALEDTATFFTAEITEAYNNLMARYKDNNLSTQNNKLPFIEEDIYVETKGYFHYILSNNVNDIINEIKKRFKCALPDSSSQIPWKINPYLSKNVKKSMNNHNMNFSMTSFWEGSIEYIIINKRSNNNWHSAGYEIYTENNTNTKTTNKTQKNTYNNAENNPLSAFIKSMITIIIFIFIFSLFNNAQTTGNQTLTLINKTSQVFAAVTSCDWLNVRSYPSSVNNNNIIEVIRVNTKV